MIIIKDLYKSYGSNQILKGIDLHVKKSEVVVVIGPSGSGKSTLLRCVNYLEVPTSGSITINKETITKRLILTISELKLVWCSSTSIYFLI